MEAGITVVLPVVRERNAPLAFLPWTPDAPMRSGAYGIQEPAAGDELPPDVVLAPTLGFTQFGDRVGYGGGYAARRGRAPPSAIGAWSCGELDADYEPAEHDYPLDAILTEDGWVPEAPLSQPGKGGKTLFSYRLG